MPRLNFFEALVVGAITVVIVASAVQHQIGQADNLTAQSWFWRIFFEDQEQPSQGSAEAIPEESSEAIPEESSEEIPEESSEAIPEESSEAIPEEIPEASESAVVQTGAYLQTSSDSNIPEDIADIAAPQYDDYDGGCCAPDTGNCDPFGISRRECIDESGIWISPEESCSTLCEGATILKSLSDGDGMGYCCDQTTVWGCVPMMAADCGVNVWGTWTSTLPECEAVCPN
jgi:hypothetical protein